jgi:hypothetical protein
MDFFQFLQKSTDDSDITTLNSSEKFVRQQGTLQMANPSVRQGTSQPIDESKKKTNSCEIEQNHLYIKRGDMVKIINVPNSILNTYKGYIGEIKNYKKDQDFALVFLHGIASATIIKFPLLHLIKYNP